MSIAKVGKTKSSGAAIDYVLKEKKREKKPKTIGGNVIGATKQEIKNEFLRQEKLNARVKNTVTHITVSFPGNEKISDEFAADYADKLVEQLGYSDNPYLVVRHYDKDNRIKNPYAHIHIVASRIRSDGSLVAEWKNAEKTIAAAKKIDHETGMESVKYDKNIIQRRTKTNEYRVMERSGKPSVMEEFKITGNSILQEIDRFDSLDKDHDHGRKIKFFVEKIQDAGFEILPNFEEKSGRMRGFSYKKNEITFKSSAAGAEFKWANLAQRTNYKPETDNQILRDMQAQTLSKRHSEKAIAEIKSEKIIHRIEHGLNEKIVASDSKNTQILSLNTNESSKENDPENTQNHSQSQQKIQIIEESKFNEKLIRSESTESANNSNEHTISDFEKAKIDLPKPTITLAEKTESKSNSSMEKAQFDGGKSSKSGNNRDDNPSDGSGKVSKENYQNEINRATKTIAFAESNSTIVNQVERVRESNLQHGKSHKPIRERDKIYQAEILQDEQELSKISEESRRIETESDTAIDEAENLNSGTSNKEERRFGNDKHRSGEANLGKEFTNSESSNADQQVSFDNRNREEEDAQSREKIFQLGAKNLVDLSLHSSIHDDSRSDNLLQRIQSERGQRSTTDSDQRVANKRSETERGEELRSRSEEDVEQNTGRNYVDVSDGETLLQSAGDESVKKLGETTETNPKSAQIAAQLISVKFFSAQIDEKIIDKWADIIENSNAEEFLDELNKQKTNEENEQLLKNISRQAELIAESLNAPNPVAMSKPDTLSLALTLTKIEVQNYKKSTDKEVNSLTLERLWNEKMVAFDESSSLQQDENNNSQGDEHFNFPILSTDLERKTLQALLDPDSISFDPDNILDTEKSVRKNEIAAKELANLVQISYGGQGDKFTSQFKSDLAEEIYYDDFSTTRLYNEFSNSNWQQTIERFAPIVNTLAEAQGILIPPPPNEYQKDLSLAQYYTDKLIFVFEQNNPQIPGQTAQAIFDSTLNLSKYPVLDNQKNQMNLVTDDSLTPPKFDNALEADVYLFDKMDESSQYQAAENLVDLIQENQNQNKEALEVQNGESQSSGLAMYQ